eukprot:gene3872-7086_t
MKVSIQKENCFLCLKTVESGDQLKFLQQEIEGIDLGLDLVSSNSIVSLPKESENNLLVFSHSQEFTTKCEVIKKNYKIYQSLSKLCKKYEQNLKDMNSLEKSISKEIQESFNIKKNQIDHINDKKYEEFHHFIDEEKVIILNSLNKILNEMMVLYSNGLEKISEFESHHKKYVKKGSSINLIENLQFNYDNTDDYLSYLISHSIDHQFIKTFLLLNNNSSLDDKMKQKIKSFNIPKYIEPKYRNQIFGVNLEDLMLRKDQIGEIPDAIEFLISLLEEIGVDSNGIFRINGDHHEIFQLKNLIDSGNFSSIKKDEITVNATASLLKLYFRELPDPLFTFKFYSDFLKYPINESDENQSQHFLSIIQKLSLIRRNTIFKLFGLFEKIATNSSSNQMNTTNLATCWALNLLKPDDQDLLSKDLNHILKTIETIMNLYPLMKDKFFNEEKIPKDKDSLLGILESFSKIEEGFLHRNELQKIFSHLEVHNSQKDVEVFIRYLSYKEEYEEKVSIQNFLIWWENLPTNKLLGFELKLKLLKKSARLFDQFDEDKNGYLDDIEMKKLLTYLFEEETFSYERCFKDLDDNIDGKISFYELTSGIFL